MPIYEYRCQACGHELERLQRMSDAALTDCPECGKSQLRRLISAAGFRLKGGGWYETDFKNANQRNLADRGGEKSADKSEGGSGSSAEGKSAEGKSKDGGGAKDSGSGTKDAKPSSAGKSESSKSSGDSASAA